MLRRSRLFRIVLWLIAIFVVIIPALLLAGLASLRLFVHQPPAPMPVPVAQFDAVHHVSFPTFAPPRWPIWGIKPEVDGYLFRPQGKGPFPAVAMLHGCSGFHTLAGYRRWVDRLTSWGYVVLVVDGLQWRGAWICAEFYRIDPKSYAGDAYGGLRYLATLPDVAADRVGLMGWSYGGMTLLTAVRNSGGPKEDPAIVKDFPAIGALRFRAGVAFYAASFSTGERYSVPLLMLVGEKDGMGNAGRLQELVENGRKLGDPLSIHVYPGAYHGFDAESPWDMGLIPFQYDEAATADSAERVHAFLDANLKRK